MTKADLVAVVSRKTGFDRADVLKIVDSAFENIQKGVKLDGAFYCRGFGTFSKKHRAQKTARNISKNTSVIIPAHHVPHFKPAQEFKKSLL